MPQYALLVLSALLITGCGSSTWQRKNTSEMQRQQDEANCKDEHALANHTERTCMEKLGYQGARAASMPW